MKKPFVSLEKVNEIRKEYPTPFHLYVEAGIRKNARALLDAFSWNKGFKEYFAVKATPTPGILKLLGEEGCGVDCSSYTELMLAEACGFSGSCFQDSPWAVLTPHQCFSCCVRCKVDFTLSPFVCPTGSRSKTQPLCKRSRKCLLS
jgi:hypothetical protein